LQLGGWPAYIITNASGQKRYPKGTTRQFIDILLKFKLYNKLLDFNPDAPMFSPHQYGQIIISNIGVFLWLSAIGVSIYYNGFLEVFKTYLVPYLW
jgi:omega-6 fatty acid desaturase / acyl-lipid omega-6 desaturase (Delta-12 desaturase)